MSQFLKMLNTASLHDTLTQNELNYIIKRYFPSETMTLATIRTVTRRELALVELDDLPRVLNLLKNIYRKIYLNNRTLDQIYTVDIRGIISKKYGTNSPEHMLAKSIISIGYAEKGVLISDAKKNITERHKNASEYSVSKIIDIIKTEIESENIFHRIVALLLASGSRPAELLSMSDYEAEGNWIIQTKVAKKRGTDFTIKKPLLAISGQVFIDTLINVRKEISEQDIKSINTKCNNSARELLGLGSKLYDCRKIYAILSWELIGCYSTNFGPNITEKIWMNLILGHAEDDLSTSNNYSHIKLID